MGPRVPLFDRTKAQVKPVFCASYPIVSTVLEGTLENFHPPSVEQR